MDTKLTIRVDAEIVAAFRAWCQANGSDVSTELRRYMVRSVRAWDSAQVKRELERERLGGGRRLAPSGASRKGVETPRAKPRGGSDGMSRQERRQLEREEAKELKKAR